MAIPAGTKFQGIPSSNDDLNKRSAQANATAPLYDISEFGGDSTQTVSTLTLQGTTNASTSQSIYGINVIDTATVSNLATRLPDPTTGKQTTFVNNSTMSILVFPSVVGGKINGIIDGVAYIPNDGKPHTFLCTANPLPGAWTWSAPAVSQIQLPTITVSHTNGNETNAYGVGGTVSWSGSPAQLINPAGTFPQFLAVSGYPTQTFTPDIGYWFYMPNLTPARSIVNTKVYSNFLRTDTSVSTSQPYLQRYIAFTEYSGGGSGYYANYEASKVYLIDSSNVPSPYVGGEEVATGALNSPVQIGDIGTVYSIQPTNTVQATTVNNTGNQTDLIGLGDPNFIIAGPSNAPRGQYYNTFSITIPAVCATKDYKFDIFLEHT
jgi:hypothetical protein